MLAEAARLARLVAATTDQGYVKRRAQAAAVTSVAWVVVGAMALIAVVFLQIALFAALLEIMPGWAAALVVAALAIILAGIAYLVAHRPGRREPLPHNETLETLAEHPDAAMAEALAPLVDEVLKATRARPGESLMLALAAGLIAGRLLRRPKG